MDQSVQIISFSLQCKKKKLFHILSSPLCEISKPFDKSELESQNQSTFAKLDQSWTQIMAPYFTEFQIFDLESQNYFISAKLNQILTK